MSLNKHIKLPVIKSGNEIEIIVHIDHIVSIVPYVSDKEKCQLITTKDEYVIPHSFETIESLFKMIQFNEQIKSIFN